MPLELPASALAQLEAARGSVDAKRKATRAQLAAICKEQGYLLYPGVIAFEASYGGLVIPDSPKQRKSDPAWLFGAHACLTSGAHTAPRGGKGKTLVPVVYSPNDVIYFLDESGGVWAQDTIEDPRAVRYAESGRELVTRILQQIAGEIAPAKAPLEKLESSSELDGKQVRLSGQKRESLPDIFEQLTELQQLDVSINALRSVPESLWRAPALEVLDLSHNPLETLSAAISGAPRLRSLGLRSCALKSLPDALPNRLEAIFLTGCDQLDVDQALHVLAKLPKLKQLSLPLSTSLTTLAPLAGSALKSLELAGNGVKLPRQLPAGLGQLSKLRDLRITYADEIAILPRAAEDVQALRLLFSKRFSDADIRKSASAQPQVRYLTAFVKTL
jgi:hypothetical protein